MSDAGGLISIFGFLFLMLALAVLIPVLAFAVGFRRRQQALDSLTRDEPRLLPLMASNFADIEGHQGTTTLVSGSVAYSADAPSRFAFIFRSLIGGQAESMTQQAEIARRVAVVRMLEQAEQMGAKAVANVRLETNEIASGTSQQKASLVIEMLAYGTALVSA